MEWSDWPTALLAPPTRAQAVKTAQAAADNDAGTNLARVGRLQAHLNAMQALTDDTVLGVAGIGIAIINAALQELAGILLPNKVLQRVKRYLGHDARKPIDMGTKTYLMHILHINTQEIP